MERSQNNPAEGAQHISLYIEDFHGNGITNNE